MKTLASMLAAAALLLSGCATTTTQTQQSAPAPAKPAAAAPAPAAQPAVVTKAIPIPAASARKLVLNMSGSKAATQARDWAAFKKEWADTFADHAKQSGIAFSMQEGPVRPEATGGTLVAVHVNDYRMVGIGARIFLGVMSGNAYIDSKASFRDLHSGRPFGEQDYNTTSSAWHGVFGRMTPQQVDGIATDVFGHLKAAK